MCGCQVPYTSPVGPAVLGRPDNEAPQGPLGKGEADKFRRMWEHNGSS